MHVTGQHSSYPTDLTTADHSTASTTATHVTGQPSSYATDLTTADYSAASTTATHVTGQPSSYATDLTTAYHTSQKLATNRQKASMYEPRCEKTGLRGFRPGPTQTGLYSHRRW